MQEGVTMTRYLDGDMLLATLNQYAKESRDNAHEWSKNTDDATDLNCYVARNFRQMADTIEMVIQTIETRSFDIDECEECEDL
jgi:hypothetical protein